VAKKLLVILLLGLSLLIYPQAKIRVAYLGLFSNFEDDSLLVRSSKNIICLFRNVDGIEIDSISNRFTQEKLKKTRSEAAAEKYDFIVHGFIEEKTLTEKNKDRIVYHTRLYYSYPREKTSRLILQNYYSGIKRNEYTAALESRNKSNLKEITELISRIKKKPEQICEITADKPVNKKNISKYKNQPPLLNAPDKIKIPETIEKTKVVVLNFKHYNLPDSLVKALNDSLSNQFKYSDNFIPVNRNDLDSILEAGDYKMVGKLSGASKIISGSVGKLGEVYSITIKMTAVNTGETELISNFREKGSVSDLFYLIHEFQGILIKKEYDKQTSFLSAEIINNKKEKNKDFDNITELLRNTSQIDKPGKFTIPETNTFKNRYGTIQLNDIIEITKGMIAYLPFYKPGKDNSNLTGIKYNKINFVEDRFFNENSACLFNSGKSCIEFSLNDSIDLSKSMTLAVNLKFYEYPKSGNMPIINKTSGKNTTFSLCLNSKGSIAFYSSAQGKIDSVNSDPVKLNKWYHIAVTLDRFDGDLCLYLNNVLVNKNNAVQIESDTTTSPVLIGKNNPSDKNGNFSGVIDDIRIYKRTLNNSEIHCLYYEKDWKYKGLVMYLPFNNGYEATRATDNYGFKKNIKKTADRFDAPENAFMFEKEKSCFGFPPFSNIDLFYRFTVSLWLNISDKNGDIGVLIDKYHPEVKNGFQLCVIKDKKNKCKIKFIHNGEYAYSTNSISIEEWHNVALVYDFGKISIYIDGKKDSEVQIKLLFAQNSSEICVGNIRKADNINSFDGILDDIRIYYRALDPQEINLLYNDKKWDE